MPVLHRLKRADFSRMSGFRRYVGTFFSFTYGFLPERHDPGGVCVVSSRTVKKAHARNKIKRRCRGLLLPILKTSSEPIVIVCYAKKGANSATFEALSADFQSFAAKLRTRH